MTVNLLDYDLEGLAAFCDRLGEKRFRATQLFRWIHQKGASNFDEMTDLAKALRDKLKASACVQGLEVTAGCAVACRFCSTGHQGFSRNLTTGEIVSQLWFAERFLRQHLGRQDRVISNVVMMGMGEPLQNYAALIPALRVMLDDHGYGLSRRRVTVSTSGVVPMIDRLAVDCPVALAVSLHAPNDALRDNLVPLNRKYPIAELLDACHRYLEHAPRDFITFEYCMLDGVNDQPEHARELIELVRVRNFSRILGEAGIVTTIRKTRGDDIDAACGQLAGDVQDRTRVGERIAQQRTVMLRPVAAFDTVPGKS